MSNASAPGPNVLYWFRRDLRLRDQPGFSVAEKRAKDAGGGIIPIFVLDPKLLGPSGANRKAFLFAALKSLAADGVPLVVTVGDPSSEIPRLVKVYSASTIVCAHDFGPYGRTRDVAVAAAVKKIGAHIEFVGSPYAVEPDRVRKLDGTPFKVFTPFSRVWSVMARDMAPSEDIAPNKTKWAVEKADLDAIPAMPLDSAPNLPLATEKAAHQRLRHFLDVAVNDYDEQRNVPSVEGTSRISADLKYGLLHPRSILPMLRDGGRGAEVFRSELCWREFYADVLWHQPHTARETYNLSMRDMDYDDGPLANERFQRWCDGTTGFPYIDAGMRQLMVEGWMHNRVRMAVASFLVKDLHLDWRWGARWFMKHLVDGDIASNQHGWQWTAGTGTDASPYYRVFNPISQGKKFDPDGIYVKRFVAELRDVDKKYVHEPWLLNTGSLFDSAPIIGYPAPMVDHATEREEALRRLHALKVKS